jgi:transglutaminase-like putative cysteine protease
MLYDIQLTLLHKYAQPAGNSRHLLRVLPQAIVGRQNLMSHMTEAFPLPEARQDRVDFFGTALTSVTQAEPHLEMQVAMACRVEVLPPQLWSDVSLNLPQLRDQVNACRDLGPAAPVHFMGPSYRLVPDAAIAAFARDVTRKGETAAETTIRLGQALHDAMQFDAKATTVDTPATDAFTLRRGVCQDFTHIMIIALQSLGIPAGYVSGYLRTLPPPGKARLVGVDAMHAWVKAWCGPAMGWVEYDPTNATLVGTDHIVVGYGRDYADVSPILGHLRSSGAPVAKQMVDVAPVE